MLAAQAPSTAGRRRTARRPDRPSRSSDPPPRPSRHRRDRPSRRPGRSTRPPRPSGSRTVHGGSPRRGRACQPTIRAGAGRRAPVRAPCPAASCRPATWASTPTSRGAASRSSTCSTTCTAAVRPNRAIKACGSGSGVPDRSRRLGPRDGNRLGCVIAQPCIADLDLHGLAVVVHRVVDEADEGLVHPFSDLHPVRGFRELEVVRSFRGGAARDGLEVVTHKVGRLPREPDSEIEPPVVLVPGRVSDPNGQTRHVGRGGRRRVDRSRRLGGRDVEVLYFVAVGIDHARVAEPDLHRLPGGGDCVLNEPRSPSARSYLPPE